MNTKYNTLYKKLINAIHPDKVGEELKEKATKLAALLNRAKDKNDEAFIQRVWDLYQAGELWTWDPDSFYSSKEKSSYSKDSSSKEKKEKKEKTFTWDWNVYQGAEAARDRDHLDRSRMAAWLNLFHGIRGAEAKTYLDKLFPVGEKGARADGYSNAFYDRMARGPMDRKEFDEWLKSQSENVRRHQGKWEAVWAMANKIWASK